MVWVERRIGDRERDIPGDTVTPTFKDSTSVYHIDTLVNRNKL